MGAGTLEASVPIHFQLADYASPRDLVSIDRAMARLERADPSKMRVYQAARLREVLGHAGKVSPYWRKVFQSCGFEPEALQDPAQLRLLPELTRAELAESGDRMLDPSARRLRWAATSGTSGAPVRVALDRRARALEFCYYRRAWGWGGYRLGAPFAELASYHFLQPGSDPDRLIEWQRLPRRLLINTLRLAPDRMGEVRQALIRHRPRFLKGLPSALQHLVHAGEESGARVPSMQTVFSGGEIVTAHARAQIEEAFACRLLDSYGHMERTLAASQCEEGRYHVHGVYGVLETVRTEARADGTLGAEVLGTGLHNRAQALVRYATGDRVVMDAERTDCPCGRSLRTLRAIEGRAADAIHTPDGRLLSGLPMAFDDIRGIAYVQLVQGDPAALEIRVVPGAGWSPAALKAVQETAARGLGTGMSWTIEIVGPEGLLRTAAGKVRPVAT
ncbi:MAG: phenylacetate-CoA ligase [Planctomycetota bacterium]|jgi:phenylacetate-CoA ligase